MASASSPAENVPPDPPKSPQMQTENGSSPSTPTEDNSADELYQFTETSHPNKVLAGLNFLRQAQKYCDITICCENVEVQCHKIVLASFSPYFQAMFSVDLKESQQDKITIKGVEADMIKVLIDYAYTSSVQITKTNVQSLLSAANLLRILPVRDACCHFMEKNMDETNCIGIHCFAEAHACTELQLNAKKFALRYFPDVYQHDEFLHLSQDKLVELISDDDLTVDSEEIVFSAVMKWLDFDFDNYSKEFHKVLQHVRLPLLSPYFLHDYVEKHSIITDSNECRKLVEEAKTYHLLLDRRAEMRSPRTRPRKASG